jgi:hypothetical protein
MHFDIATLMEIKDKNKDKTIENLRSIAEALVWSEQNGQNLFE